MKKICTQCKIEKDFSDYYKSKTGKYGIYAECKTCFCKRQRKFEARPDVLKKKAEARKLKRHTDPVYHKNHLQRGALWQKNNKDLCNAKAARYRVAKIKAIPLWHEKEKINLIYKKAKQYGMVVDHIVPLQSKIVCGLHVWSNLQLLHPSLNSEKCNRYWPDMPIEENILIG